MQAITSSSVLQQYGGLSALPGYQVYEYQLVLALPGSVKEKIKKVKQQFAERYHFEYSRSSAIMLPLVKFKQRQLLEQKFRNALYQLVLGWRPFTVNLKDFAGQPTHSLYIPVSSKNQLQGCTKSLKSMQQLLRPDKEQQPYFPAEHRIVLASRLGAGTYESAMEAYAGRHFTAQFMVDAALLLKRKTGDVHWQIAQRFEFRNLPVGVVQTSLFEA